MNTHDTHFDYASAPNPRTVNGVRNYIEYGVPPGCFLRAIIVGDLHEAARRADVVNQHLLYEWAHWFQNHAPIACFGSEEAYRTWIKMGGYKGIKEASEASKQDKSE